MQRYLSILVIWACLNQLGYATELPVNKPQVKLSPSAAPVQSIPVQAKPQFVVYKTVSADGVAHFSDQRPRAVPFELLRYDCFACAPASSINWQNTPLFTQRFSKIISTVAHEQQLEKALIRAVIHAESAFNPAAISAKGAAGLMQLMPTTMQHFAVQNALEPEQNIRAGSQYLAKLLVDFNGDLPLALAAYNAGPGAVRRYNGIPPFPETQAYVERVQILLARYAQNP
ncbi:lytic transglycosylase [Alishewanella longhuensis]|uniref:Lytic transglycosylase n=1 Tax=Alishewanella longhuensis TaxID=1091037 RepID=A0ABQ3L462_9ALTE|nr:lytic transglycosylase domain-containing protein [Alishewanella longhuensis]GHG63823.1 lytic transglycosylase [Alishewanella longhuensis]